MLGTARFSRTKRKSARSETAPTVHHPKGSEPSTFILENTTRQTVGSTRGGGSKHHLNSSISRRAHARQRHSGQPSSARRRRIRDDRRLPRGRAQRDHGDERTGGHNLVFPNVIF